MRKRNWQIELLLLLTPVIPMVLYLLRDEQLSWEPRNIGFHKYGASALAFSSDGKLLASGGTDKAVRLWNVESGRLLHTLTFHDYITCIAFALDGRMVASASNDGTLRLWDTRTGTTLQEFNYKSPVLAVAFSPDGGTLASGGYKVPLQLRDVQSGVVIRTISRECYILSLDYSPDSKLLAGAGGPNCLLRLWDARTGALQKGLEKVSGTAWRSVAFSGDGKTLVAGGQVIGRTAKTLVNRICLWNVGSRKLMQTLPQHRPGYVTKVAFAPDGQTVAYSGYGEYGDARLWDVQKQAVVRTLAEEAPIWDMALAFSPDGKRIATGSSYGDVKLWRIQ